jgi:hypothetical protein
MTTIKRKYTVGFIGMAGRIAAYGYPLHAYDISAAAIKEFCNWVAYARAAKTPTEIGQSWAAPRTTPR